MLRPLSRIPPSVRRVDVVLVGCCLAAPTVYLLNGLDGQLNRDMGLYLYGGQRVLEGEPPYVGVRNRAGPLAHLLPAIGMAPGRLLGVDDVMAARVFFLLLAVCCIGAVYLLGHSIFASRAAGIVAAATMLAFQGFAFMATHGPKGKTPMVLFATLALLAAVHQRWMLTGGLIAIATLTWQPSFFPLIAATAPLTMAGRAWRGLGRAAVYVVVGGAVPTAVTLLCYAAVGRLRLFLDWFVLVNARYTRQMQPLDNPDFVWERLVAGYGWTVWLLVAGFATSLVAAALAIWRLRRIRSADAEHADAGPECRRRRVGLVGAGMFMAGGVLWTLRAFDSWADTMVLLPAAAIGVASIADAVIRRSSPRAAVGVTAIVATGCLVSASVHAVETRNDGLVAQRNAVAAVFDEVPDATLVALEAPVTAVLSGRRNPARIQLFGNGMLDYITDTWRGGARGYGRWIVNRDATLIVTGSDLPWLVNTMRQKYRRAARACGWTWWVSLKVDPETRRAIRTAVRASRAADPPRDATTSMCDA